MKTQAERIKILMEQAAEFAEIALRDGLFGSGCTDDEIAKAAIDFIMEHDAEDNSPANMFSERSRK